MMNFFFNLPIVKKEMSAKQNKALNTFSQALLLVHEFYHRAGLAKETTFVKEVRFLGTQFLDNALGTETKKNARAMGSFLRAFQKPTLTIGVVEKYTLDPYLQCVAAAFALASLGVWFDYGFGTKVCSVEVLGLTVYKDKHCPKVEEYTISFLLATKQLYVCASKLIGTNMAKLPINKPLISKKLVSHLSLR